MSDSTSAQAPTLTELSELVASLNGVAQQLSSLVERIAKRGEWIEEDFALPYLWVHNIEEFQLRHIFSGVETGPPEVPSFCVELAWKFGPIGEEVREKWLRRFFCSGFWARVALDCCIPFEEEPLVEEPQYWIVLRGGLWQGPALFGEKEDVDRFLSKSEKKDHIVQCFTSLGEALIFSCGAGTRPPTYWKWTSRV